MAILARYLDPQDQSVRADGVLYEKSAAKLVAYCLMGNYFHLLLFQDQDEKDISKLMSSVMTAYGMYLICDTVVAEDYLRAHIRHRSSAQSHI